MSETNTEANKVIRVLSGERQKYTVLITLQDGSQIEIQSNHPPQIDWNAEARELWLTGKLGGKYDNETYPIMRADLIKCMICEENPGPPVASA